MPPLPENRLFLVRGNTSLTRHKQRNAYKAVTKIPEKISVELDTSKFDLVRAAELMRLSNFSYELYDQFKDGKIWEIPAPFDKYFYKNPITVIYAPSEKVDSAYGESNTGPISIPIPMGFITESISSNDVYISWRGTKTIYEWIQDATFEQVPCSFLPSPQNEMVHKGFFTLYTSDSAAHPSPQNAVKNYLNGLTDKHKKRVWITGHSLGGAMCVLNTCDILANIPGFKSVITYNFASSRVGDVDFVKTFNSKILINGKPSSWRIPNDGYDIVTMLPPEVMGYQHVNELYSITFGNKLPVPPTISEILKNHNHSTYFIRLTQLLKENGFTAKQLKDIHFSYAELVAAGYTISELIDAGFIVI